MSDEGDGEASPADRLPDDLVARLDDLDHDELDATVTYAQSRIRELHRPIVENVRAAVDEADLVRIDDHDGYAIVERREGDHDLTSLYMVTHEKGMDGEVRLNWTLLDDTDSD